MANVGVSVRLDEDRVIKYDFNACAAFEEEVGFGVTEAFSGRQVGFRVIRALVWAGLLGAGDPVSLETTGERIQKRIDAGLDLQGLMDAIMSALEKSELLGKGVHPRAEVTQG